MMACPSLLSDDDLRRFRTKPCRRHRGGETCEFGLDRCQYSHCPSWPRRCPFYLSNANCIRYIPIACPDVVLCEIESPGWRTVGGVASNSCTRGGSCPFAHSLEELYYHPLTYKTRQCSLFTQGRCDAYYCPDTHGTAEHRHTSGRTFFLPFISNMEFESIVKKSFPNVICTPAIPKLANGTGAKVNKTGGSGAIAEAMTTGGGCNNSSGGSLTAITDEAGDLNNKKTITDSSRPSSSASTVAPRPRSLSPKSRTAYGTVYGSVCNITQPETTPSRKLVTYNCSPPAISLGKASPARPINTPPNGLLPRGIHRGRLNVPQPRLMTNSSPDDYMVVSPLSNADTASFLSDLCAFPPGSPIQQQQQQPQQMNNLTTSSRSLDRLDLFASDKALFQLFSSPGGSHSGCREKENWLAEKLKCLSNMASTLSWQELQNLQCDAEDLCSKLEFLLT